MTSLIRMRKTGASYAHAERLQRAITAWARAAGQGGRGLLSFFPCALTLQEKRPKNRLKQKAGKQGQRKEGNLLK